MNKKIKLSESDLMRIVKRVVNEQSFDESNDYEKNMMVLFPSYVILFLTLKKYQKNLINLVDKFLQSWNLLKMMTILNLTNQKIT